MGDNIILFFNYEYICNNDIVLNTETMITQITSYATMRFDKIINANIETIANHYNTEIAQDLLEQDYIFRSVLITPSEQEQIIDYIDYIVYKCTQHIGNEWNFFGTIVKVTLDDNDNIDFAYQNITEDNAEQLLDIEFIESPYIPIEQTEQ